MRTVKSSYEEGTGRREREREREGKEERMDGQVTFSCFKYIYGFVCGCVPGYTQLYAAGCGPPEGKRAARANP